MTKNKWVNHYSDNTGAQVSLFCFPHAGGSSLYFARWARIFSPNINTYPVEYPMREKRVGELMPESLQALAESMAEECLTQFQKPFSLFGHCTGAIIAYEVAVYLERYHGLTPQALFVSSSVAPEHSKMQAIQDMPDEEFIAFIRNYGTVNPVFLENKELMDYYLPIVRKDFELHRNYIYNSTHSPLRCPLFALNGADDFNILSHKQVGDWKNHTFNRFEAEIFNGGHFYLDEHLAEVCNFIENRVVV